MDLIITLLTFIFGIFIGWFTNHWYSVNLKQPELCRSGSGSGSNFLDSGFRYTHLSIKNELRSLAIRLPETIILGKRLKTHFGNQIIERDPARKCRAHLLDESGKHICPLYWLSDNSVLDTVDIQSGESVSLLTFVRESKNLKKFYVYQRKSQSDLTPQTTEVPNFNKSTKFKINISYSHNKNFSFPIEVEIDYRDNLYVRTENSSNLF